MRLNEIENESKMRKKKKKKKLFAKIDLFYLSMKIRELDV